MGKALSAIVSVFTDESVENKMNDAKASLELLTAMARKQEEIFKNKLTNYYTQDDQFKKYQVVGGRLVQQTSFISASSHSGPNQEITAGLESTMSGLFSLTFQSEDDQKENKDNLKDGLTKMVTGAFKAILGESHATETQSSHYFIIPIGYAFYRVDTFMWKWNVSAKSGLHEKCHSVTVTVSGCGVLDHTNIKTDELIAFVQQVKGRNSREILRWFKEFNLIVETINELKKKHVVDEAIMESTRESAKRGDFNAYNNGNQRSGLMLTTNKSSKSARVYTKKSMRKDMNPFMHSSYTNHTDDEQDEEERGDYMRNIQ